MPASIDIRAAPDLYQAIAEMPLSATKSIALCVEGSGVSDPDAIAAVCHVLAKSQGCTRKELHVDIVTLPVLPALVTCTDLTALNVLAPTSVDSMLGLITRLPRLAKLVLHRVTFDKIQTDLSVPPRDAYDLIAPLDTQLERLSINPVRQQGVVDAVIQTINYLLLKIPTLGYIDSTHAPKQQVLEFVGDNVWRYPHLAHVNLNLSSA
ncbi:hypothetical protein H4R21_000001 [Coemansia helicoidea]|uniref:Uncharacterized protein n=1 Tax=Coemansia helicoidea TaxID=1286919 RepID=A0ACC1LHS3_9FUNG|nr:hypothetical protein H4R21_000001 [Coemansia helicoidea]